MCGSLFGGSPPPPPPPKEDKTGKAIRERQRIEEAANAKKNKEDLLAQRIRQYRHTMAGGSSLLQGRRGGQGFEVSSQLLSRDTLGA
jgi:hypothetical protein